MNVGTRPYIPVLLSLISQAGFYPMTEFSAVDSLTHIEDMLGVISIETSSVTACAYNISDMKLYTQTDTSIKLHLYGKSGDFVDYDIFSQACDDLFYTLVSSEDLLICKMNQSRTTQSMPLKRLERVIELTVRTTQPQEVPDDRS